MMAKPNTAPTMCTFELIKIQPRPSGQALEVQSRCDGKVTRFYDGVPGRDAPSLTAALPASALKEEPSPRAASSHPQQVFSQPVSSSLEASSLVRCRRPKLSSGARPPVRLAASSTARAAASARLLSTRTDSKCVLPVASAYLQTRSDHLRWTANRPSIQMHRRLQPRCPARHKAHRDCGRA